jgi:tetratricopeptide (TPR) repeat protein
LITYCQLPFQNDPLIFYPCSGKEISHFYRLSAAKMMQILNQKRSGHSEYISCITLYHLFISQIKQKFFHRHQSYLEISREKNYNSFESGVLINCFGGKGDEVGAEGFSVPQGCDYKILGWWPDHFYKLVIAALVVSIFAGKGQAGLFNDKKHSHPYAYSLVESDDSSLRIKQLVRELQYSDEVAEDFIAMVNIWQNRKSKPFFAVQRQKLLQIRENYKQGRIKIADAAKAEECVAAEIARLIKDNLSCSDEFFELDDVIRNKQASCLGYTQIFYILSNSVGLPAIPINVVELQTPGPLPTGAAHVSCIVRLSDDRTIMLNLVPDGFVSGPFIMEEKFTKIGNYWQLKDKDNPLNIYRKIRLLDRDGLLAYIYSNRGNVYASAGQFNQSISDYTGAIKLNPDFAEAYNNRGIAYRNTGQLKQAIADYTKAIELNPNYAWAYNNRGIAYIKLGQLYQGLYDYDKSIELDPKLAEAYNNRANAYAKLGQFERAILDYTRAIKNNSDFAVAYGNRAVTYALLGKTEGARKDLRKAVELNPALKVRVKNLSEEYKLGLAFD